MLTTSFFYCWGNFGFYSQAAVIKYFGANAKNGFLIRAAVLELFGSMFLHYFTLFSSIHKRGAGLGPAIAVLYSGPAINILAIILTARI
jgi:uncharacterized membrane protein YraQ (UPF0718 family)